jgi:hypothetical protein
MSSNTLFHILTYPAIPLALRLQKSHATNTLFGTLNSDTGPALTLSSQTERVMFLIVPNMLYTYNHFKLEQT